MALMTEGVKAVEYWLAPADPIMSGSKANCIRFDVGMGMCG